MSIAEQLMGTVSTATSAFMKCCPEAAVSCGPMRDIGSPGFAVIVDCNKYNKRIAVFVLDAHPDVFTIGVADKATPDKATSKQLPLSQLTAETILNYMEAEFSK